MTEKKSILKCPVCDLPLFKEAKIYRCENKHTYDIAKQGFVNLLLANQKASKEPGDSKEMMQARTEFLAKGYYSKLTDAINEYVIEKLDNNAEHYKILDAGCGEGYYLNRLHDRLKEIGISEQVSCYGFDISKEGVKHAASSNKSITWAVGSTFHMPILSDSTHCLLQIFAPACEAEFQRVLKEDSILIAVIPGKDHLYGLKEQLYDEPYYNDEEVVEYSSLKIIEQFRIKYDIHLNNEKDIQNLLKMTPYYWKTNKDRIEEINKVTALDTCVDFIIVVYKKPSK